MLPLGIPSLSLLLGAEEISTWILSWTRRKDMNVLTTEILDTTPSGGTGARPVSVFKFGIPPSTGMFIPDCFVHL